MIEPLLSEIAGLGESIVKRIYGDFTSTQSAQWKKILNQFSIKPMQQFAYTTGKNSTDSALIIDAMDLLHSGNINVFCLVSSDSDFTGLALRIREAGLLVYGFGEQKTPEAFRNACHKFIFTELLQKPDKSDSNSSSETNSSSDKMASGIKSQKFPTALICEAIEKSSDDSGWAGLGAVGSYLNKVRPDFDARLFGAQNSKLSTLMKMNPKLIELKERQNNGTFVRVKPKKTAKEE